MPTVTVRKQTKDMFGNNCEPCDQLNTVDQLGTHQVETGSSFDVQTRPSTAPYSSEGTNLPSGFRTKTITATDLVTGQQTVYSDGGSGGIASASFPNIQHDTDIMVDFGEGPHTSHGVSSSVMNEMGEEDGGSVDIAPYSEDGTYLNGQKLIILTTPDEGYEIEDVEINGESYGDSNLIEYNNLEDDLIIQASFRNVACTTNIVQIKRGNTAGLSGTLLYSGELAYNVESGELRIGINEEEPSIFENCNVIGSGGESGGGTGDVQAYLPTDSNCLVAWLNTNQKWLKNAGKGAWLPYGLFVKMPYGIDRGQYKIKTYGSPDTSSYAGIVDLSTYCNNDNYNINNPCVGFVCNLITEQNTSQFGGGLLISGAGSQGDLMEGSPDP